jgi:hypothetical protein
LPAPTARGDQINRSDFRCWALSGYADPPELWDIGISRCGIEVAIRRDDMDAVDDRARHRYDVLEQTGSSHGSGEAPERCRARLYQG